MKDTSFWRERQEGKKKNLKSQLVKFAPSESGGRKAVSLFCIKMKDILDKEEVDELPERSFFMNFGNINTFNLPRKRAAPSAFFNEKNGIGG